MGNREILNIMTLNYEGISIVGISPAKDGSLIIQEKKIKKIRIEDSPTAKTIRDDRTRRIIHTQYPEDYMIVLTGEESDKIIAEYEEANGEGKICAICGDREDDISHSFGRNICTEIEEV